MSSIKPADSMPSGHANRPNRPWLEPMPISTRALNNPGVAKSFALKDIADNHRYMESNQQIGKIVVRTDA